MLFPVALCLLATGASEKTTDKIFDSGNQRFKFVLHLERSKEFDGFTLSVSIKGSKYSSLVKAGETYTEFLKYRTYNFTKDTKKQLFVSGRLGAVHTHIFDIDPSSNTLKEIYSKGGGRVVVTPIRNQKGGYDIEEKWEKRQWDTITSRGVGHYDRSSNTVTRLLRWNGKAFVPVAH